jgi:isoleucyl-tRNA synthetase
VAAAIAAADPAALAAELRTTGEVQIAVDGVVVSIGPDDVVVTQTPIAGWTVASDGGETVALEVTITPELRREGLAREFIRQVQDARKTDGFDVSDRISVRWSTADPELSAALAEHQTLISGEVLAVDFAPTTHDGTEHADGAGGSNFFRHESPDLGLTFWLQALR